MNIPNYNFIPPYGLIPPELRVPNLSMDYALGGCYTYPSLFDNIKLSPATDVNDLNIFGYTPSYMINYFDNSSYSNPPYNVFPHVIDTFSMNIVNPFWTKPDFSKIENSYYDKYMSMQSGSSQYNPGNNFMSLTCNNFRRPVQYGRYSCNAYSRVQQGAKPTVEKAIQLAKSQVGVSEVNGSNDSPQIRKYKNGLADNTPWCASFGSWLYGSGQNGNNGSTFGYTASSQEIRHRAENAGYYADKNSGYKPKEGDLMILKNPDNNGGHVGIIVDVKTDGSFDTIEGNSGNQVRQVHRNMCTNNLHGFVRMNDWLNVA